MTRTRAPGSSLAMALLAMACSDSSRAAKAPSITPPRAPSTSPSSPDNEVAARLDRASALAMLRRHGSVELARHDWLTGQIQLTGTFGSAFSERQAASLRAEYDLLRALERATLLKELKVEGSDQRTDYRFAIADTDRARPGEVGEGSSCRLVIGKAVYEEVTGISIEGPEAVVEATVKTEVTPLLEQLNTIIRPMKQSFPGNDAATKFGFMWREWPLSHGDVERQERVHVVLKKGADGWRLSP